MASNPRIRVLEAQLRIAEAKVTYAQQQLNRGKQLIAENSISQYEYDGMVRDLAVAKNERDIAEAQLEIGHEELQ